MKDIQINKEAVRHLVSSLQGGVVERADTYLRDDVTADIVYNDRAFLGYSPYNDIVEELTPFFGYYDRVTGVDEERSEQPVCALQMGAAFAYGALQRTRLTLSEQLDEYSRAIYSPGFILDGVNVNGDNAQIADDVYRIRSELERRAQMTLGHLAVGVVEKIENMEELLIPDIDAQRVFRVGVGLVLYDAVFADVWAFRQEYDDMLGRGEDENQRSWDISEIDQS